MYNRIVTLIRITYFYNVFHKKSGVLIQLGSNVALIEASLAILFLSRGLNATVYSNKIAGHMRCNNCGRILGEVDQFYKAQMPVLYASYGQSDDALGGNVDGYDLSCELKVVYGRRWIPAGIPRRSILARVFPSNTYFFLLKP